MAISFLSKREYNDGFQLVVRVVQELTWKQQDKICRYDDVRKLGNLVVVV